MALNPEIEQFPESEFCPGFWKINAVSGCPYHCAGCYLDASHGRFNGGRRINSVAPVDKTLKVTRKWLNNMGSTPGVLVTGETGDSFAFFDHQAPMTEEQWVEDITHPLTELFSGKPQQILYVTKSSGPAVLAAAPSPQSIFSFSINPPKVCEAFTAPFVRWDTLRAVAKQGKRLRLRLDPLIPVNNWRAEYEAYIKFLAWERGVISPEMFTLGSLRLTAANYRLRRSQKLSLLEYVDYDKGGGSHPYRVPYSRRREMYEHVIGLLRKYFPHPRIGLCKETEDMRTSCGVRRGNCNCQL